MATHSLNGGTTPVDLGDGFTIVAPDVRGTLVSTVATPGVVARGFGEESFDAQLASAGLTRVRIFDVEGTVDVARDFAPDAAPPAPPVGVLEVPAAPGESAIVLVEDERGALRWVLPDTTRGLEADDQGGMLTFSVPLSPAATGARGGIGGFFKKVVKVFKFPFTKVEEGLGDIVAGFIRRWEQRNRPYLICTYGPSDYRAPDHAAHAVSQQDWARLASGRALLFVHGTFSSCDAFFGITPDVMETLSRRYEGRLFAFNHPTMSENPTENARHFLASIPAAQESMTIDIVCHSRGGMVAREIAQLGRARGVNVGRIVMVGVPNGGTPLADRQHMVAMIDRFTTVAKIFPNRAATIVVDALVAAVKVLARALLDDMVGLKAMNPGEEFVRALNAGACDGTELFAIVSNFEPPPGTALFSLTRAKDAAADFAFGNAANDLVVPTEGGFAVAAAGFPVPEDRRFQFAPEAGVIHTEFFTHAETHRLLTEWVEPSPARDLATVRARGLSPAEIQSLRPHVVNLTNGVFSRRGGFTTTREDVDAIFERDLPAWVASRPAGSPVRIVFWAHGGLINEQDGLEIAFKHISWWKSNGVYPIYFVWETGLFDALGSLLSSAARTSRAVAGRGFTDFTDGIVEKTCRLLRGDLVWGAMKTNAARCSAPGGGAAYVAEQLKKFCGAHPNVELHAAGHSAGSIFHSHFLPAAKKAGVPSFTTLQLLAPAIRVDAFKQRLVPLIGSGVQSLTMYTMTDDYERRDSCLGIYRKSLLYLIHHALEDDDGVPILGLKLATKFDRELNTLFPERPVPGSPTAAVWSVSDTSAIDAASRSTSHGGFDDDAATMTSVAARVLGNDRARLEPYVGDARRGREWPLSPQIETAIEAPVAEEATFEMPSISVATPAIITAPSGGRRLALCIGIDRYPGSNALFGCVNDARAWKTLLESKLHFDRVSVLADDKATRGGIARAVESLLTDARPGDTVVIQYSGHGTSLPDDDGDESDGTDEALVPIDFESAQFITDDDIRGFITQHLKDGVSLTIFMDCCHSGTITRMLGRTASPPLPGVRARFMRVDPEIVKAYRALRAVERKEGRLRAFADRASLRWVNFSACESTEKAYEQNGNGDFTRYATALLAGGIDMTNREFQMRLMREFGEQRRQTPRLDCPLDAEEVGLLRFVAGGRAVATKRDAERRIAGERRAPGQAVVPYDRRVGERRHQQTAAELRDIADRVESWSRA